MNRFSDLLRAAVRQCNRVGASLAFGVLLFGFGAIMLESITLQFVSGELTRHTQAFLPAEQWTEAEKAIVAEGGFRDPKTVFSVTIPRLTGALGALPAEEQEAELMAMMTTTVRERFSMLLTISASMFLLWTVARAFFLTIGSSATALSPTTAGRRSLSVFLRLLAVWLMLGAATLACILIPGIFTAALFPAAVPAGVFIGVGLTIALLPRLLLAPALIADGHAGIVTSLRTAFRSTAGQWLRVTLNLIGAGAVTWAASAVGQVIVNILMYVTESVSAGAWRLQSLMALVMMLCVAYRSVFTVQLKRAIIDK